MNPALRSLLRPGFAALLLFFLGACAPTHPEPGEPADPTDPTGPVSPGHAGGRADTSASIAVRVLYLIHGDADYSWHDSSGRRLAADQEALRQALEVSRSALHAEVFIFHQRGNRGIFFRKPDGVFYHYRAGSLLEKETYFRAVSAEPSDSALDLTAEAALLLRRSMPSNPAARKAGPSRLVAAYFGHEIPLHERAGYSASYPEAPFSIARFARGLDRLESEAEEQGDMRGDGKRRAFDLVVLSTCYGGSPAMMQALAARADYAVASPAYLHLSFLDTRALAGFTGDPTSAGLRDAYPDSVFAAISARHEIQDLADTIAAQSFAHLRVNTQTEITVTVYDLKKIRPVLDPRGAEMPQASVAESWRDCALDPAFRAADAFEGVRLFYNPPRFGPRRNTVIRSAWQCPD